MLLGRARERQEIDRVLAAARSGRSAVLALVGEPGIGKSALLDHAADHAAGLSVLRARGIESEAHVPFAGLLELLRPALRLIDRIPAPRAAALEGALALRPGGSEERFAVGAATLSLVAAYAEETPVALLVDDAHWLDGSSADALLFALRRLVADPVAALVAARTGEPSMLDGADLPTITVEGLDRQASSDLLGQVAPEVVERLYRATGGNPLALIELAGQPTDVAAVRVDAPVSISATIATAFLRRANLLAEHARQVLVLAAASDTGDVVTLGRAAASLGLDLGDLAAAEGLALVSLRDGRVEFRHPLARSALYGDAPAEQRRAAHRALAGALPDRDVDRRAWHLAVAAVGPDDAASAALEQAGARARDRSAYVVSAAAFERAARLAVDDERRGRLLWSAADAAWLGGLADRAVDHLAEARELTSRPERLVEIDHLRGHITMRRGPVLEGHRIIVDAAEAAALASPERAVVMLAEALNACFYAGDAAEMLRVAERARALLPARPTSRAEFFSELAFGMAQVIAGDGRVGTAAIRRAVAVAEASEELRDDPHLLAWLVMGPNWLREAKSGRRLIDRALETARDRAAVGVLPFLLTHVARDRAAGDQWHAAQAGYQEAIAIARETGQRAELASGLAGLTWLEARQGRERECRTHATEARAVCREHGLGLYDLWAISALGDLELGLGNLDAAIGHYEDLAERLRLLRISDVDLSPAAELVEAYLRLGRPDDAAQVAAALTAGARAKGQPWSLARAARCAGLLSHNAQLDEHFEEALRLHEHTPDAYETARTRLAYGARLRRARQRVRAREVLRAALEVFDRLGAQPWSEAARRELAATGETARRRDASMLDTLTPQELQIALLLGDGKTTRETAAALFLSPKTVEYHLRHVYQKLGVRSRDELAKAL